MAEFVQQDDTVDNEYVSLLKKRPKLADNSVSRAQMTTQASSTRKAGQTTCEEQQNNTQAESRHKHSKTMGDRSCLMSMSEAERDLMNEFGEDTETIFKQSETCYIHYKEILRDVNAYKIHRPEKKFFKEQVIMKKDGLFDKKVPTWASSWELLARVTKLQKEHGMQSRVKETQESRRVRIKAEQSQLDVKLRQLASEMKQESMNKRIRSPF